MYENIVNSLRYCAENDCSPECPRAGIGKGCISGPKREAADAIDELSKYADTIRQLKFEGWYLQKTKFHDGCQAVSTKPLPDPPKEE